MRYSVLASSVYVIKCTCVVPENYTMWLKSLKRRLLTNGYEATCTLSINKLSVSFKENINVDNVENGLIHINTLRINSSFISSQYLFWYGALLVTVFSENRLTSEVST
mgnify:CR=1 FL=1